MHAFPIRTERMELIPATVKLYLLDLHDRTGLATALNASVPGEWPPEQITSEVIEEFLKLMRAGDRKVWSFYWLAQPDDCDPNVLIGSGGFLASAKGGLELGYSVLPTYQQQGYATEAVRSMVEWAFSALRIDHIIAYTYPHLIASIRVLEKNGFTFTGNGPEEGTITYELRNRPEN
ncbi:GNAT family N-acetyltransferase [Methanosarcina sp. Mfa9]|uniref:GNAT family N-acetyltransferase n=1 Tax=Methanosarcina sp. Mfa9 TaxID=3439063 RepID=UPI003F831A87